MIRTGLQRLDRDGLSLSLEHLSFEQIVAEAGVARASVYRRWPHKDLYFSDLLVALAQAHHLDPSPAGIAGAAEELLRDLATEQRADLREEQTRRDLLVTALRVSVEAELAGFVSAARYHRHLALMATALGLPDGPLRRDVTAALATAEQRFTQLRAAVYADVVPLMGFRLRTPVPGPAGYLLLSAATGAAMQGMVVKLLADPQYGGGGFEAAAFGATRVQRWTLGGYVVLSALFAHIEPDPTVLWDDTRVAAVTRALRERLAQAPAWESIALAQWAARLKAGQPDDDGGVPS